MWSSKLESSTSRSGISTPTTCSCPCSDAMTCTHQKQFVDAELQLIEQKQERYLRMTSVMPLTCLQIYKASHVSDMMQCRCARMHLLVMHMTHMHRVRCSESTGKQRQQKALQLHKMALHMQVATMTSSNVMQKEVY